VTDHDADLRALPKIELHLHLDCSLSFEAVSRVVTPATLTGELAGLRRVFGWGARELLETNLMAVQAAFVDEPVKERLRRVLASAYGSPSSPPSFPRRVTW